MEAPVTDEYVKRILVKHSRIESSNYGNHLSSMRYTCSNLLLIKILNCYFYMLFCPSMKLCSRLCYFLKSWYSDWMETIIIITIEPKIKDTNKAIKNWALSGSNVSIFVNSSKTNFVWGAMLAQHNVLKMTVVVVLFLQRRHKLMPIISLCHQLDCK